MRTRKMVKRLMETAEDQRSELNHLNTRLEHLTDMVDIRIHEASDEKTIEESVKAGALTSIWRMLGAVNQTEACQEIRRLQKLAGAGEYAGPSGACDARPAGISPRWEDDRR